MASYKQNFLILGLCLSAFLFIPIRINTVQNEFDQYLAKYNKSYNATEYKQKLEIYRKSLDVINKYNTGRIDDNVSAIYGITEFTDLIPEALLSDLLYPKFAFRKEQQPLMKWSPQSNIPVRIDWREKSVITNVNNQKACGACYAFTTIETIESMNAIRSGKLEKFSVQEMIDCSFVNNGCDGGDSCTLLEWVKVNNIKILKEDDYPLHLIEQDCRIKNTSGGIYIKSFKCENLVNNEEAILQYLAHVGPVIAAVNAAPWHYYIEGIIRYHCDHSTKSLNHAVQIVGYDMSERVPYYIVRNSWGTNFGSDGYLKIVIGQNMCGIANRIVTVTV